MEPQNTISFDNLEVAFASKSNNALKKMYLLFATLNNNTLVKVGSALTKFALKIHLPIKGIIRSTVYEQFCGGETIEDSEPTIQELAQFNIGTILDYSVEGATTEKGFESTANEIIKTIEKAAISKHIPFSVFKVTGIASTPLLEKVQSKAKLTDAEVKAFQGIRERVDRICGKAYEHSVRIFVDGEESWIQDVIDDLVYEMMEKYNKEQVIVYNTYQMYRHEMLGKLRNAHQLATMKQFYLGAKLVRGAYMEKERERAEKMGYPDPINLTKEATDKDYNDALKFCLNSKARVALCSGSHNEYSNYYLTVLMEKHSVKRNDPNVFFAQLYGMSDNISFNLAKEGYNVAKYVPYGPIVHVMPYLFRRAEENTSVAGQSSREFTLVKREMDRRKNQNKAA